MAEPDDGPATVEVQGRRLRRGQIETVRETVELFPKNGHRELSRAICENLGWTRLPARTGNGSAFGPRALRGAGAGVAS